MSNLASSNKTGLGAYQIVLVKAIISNKLCSIINNFKFGALEHGRVCLIICQHVFLPCLISTSWPIIVEKSITS